MLKNTGVLEELRHQTNVVKRNLDCTGKLEGLRNIIPLQSYDYQRYLYEDGEWKVTVYDFLSTYWSRRLAFEKKRLLEMQRRDNVTIQKLIDTLVHERYQPGGSGYKTTETHFQHLVMARAVW